jgi:hypothetical protein
VDINLAYCSRIWWFITESNLISGKYFTCIHIPSTFPDTFRIYNSTARVNVISVLCKLYGDSELLSGFLCHITFKSKKRTKVAYGI